MWQRKLYLWNLLVDFQKAVGTVDHHILLKKNSIRWYLGNLSNRKHFVSVGG